jgi:hypothetical protein
VVGVERASTVAGIVITATLVVGTGTAIGIVVAGAVGGDVGAGVGVGIGGKSSDGSTVVDVVDVVGEFVAWAVVGALELVGEIVDVLELEFGAIEVELELDGSDVEVELELGGVDVDVGLELEDWFGFMSWAWAVAPGPPCSASAVPITKTMPPRRAPNRPKIRAGVDEIVTNLPNVSGSLLALGP